MTSSTHCECSNDFWFVNLNGEMFFFFFSIWYIFVCGVRIGRQLSWIFFKKNVWYFLCNYSISNWDHFGVPIWNINSIVDTSSPPCLIFLGRSIIGPPTQSRSLAHLEMVEPPLETLMQAALGSRPILNFSSGPQPRATLSFSQPNPMTFESKVPTR